MASIIDDCKQEMEHTVAAFKRDLSRLRTSRATTALLDGITVDYYGAKTPLNQLASLSAPEPRLLVIQPFDRTAIGEIERAIFQSDLGLTPANDGKIIRIPIPELTEERRRELVQPREEDGRGVPRLRPRPSSRRDRDDEGAPQGEGAHRRRSQEEIRSASSTSPRSTSSASTSS